MDEKSYKNIFIYYVGYVTIKKLYALFLIKWMLYFEKIQRNKYLTPVTTIESKGK